MSEFINTIDALGDDAVVDSIIYRTITEFKDDMLTSIGDYAFQYCTDLTNVEIPNVTKLGVSCFRDCSQLTTVDTSKVTSVSHNVFRSTSITSLMLRNETVPNLIATSLFLSTPIASGTGYIYVPAALVDSYKTATNWSTYAAQFRALEDYTVDGTITGKLDETKI